MAIRVLGIDPGFRSLGWAIIEYDGSLAKCVEAGVIRTQKSKHKIPVWQDNQARCKTIGEDLKNVCTSYNIKLIAVEAESWTRTSSDRVIGMARGLIYGLAVDNWPLTQWHPKDVKQELTGKKSASKTEITEWLCDNIPGASKYLMRIPKTQREHAADAAAIALTEIKRGNLVKLYLMATGEGGHL